MLTYKVRKDMHCFVFSVVSLQLIQRLSHCDTDICHEFSHGKEHDSSKFSEENTFCRCIMDNETCLPVKKESFSQVQ